MAVTIMRQCKSDTDINGVSVAFRGNKMHQFRNDRWARPGVIIDKDFNWNYNLLKPFGKNLWTAQVTKCQIIISDMDDDTRFLNGGKIVLKTCYSDEEVLNFFMNEQKLILSQYQKTAQFWKIPSVSSAFNLDSSLGKHDIKSWMQLHCQVVYDVDDLVPGTAKCLGKIPFSGIIGLSFKRLFGKTKQVKIVKNIDPNVNAEMMKKHIKFNNTYVKPVKNVSAALAFGTVSYTLAQKYENQDDSEKNAYASDNNVKTDEKSNVQINDGSFMECAVEFIKKSYGIISSNIIPKTDIPDIDAFEANVRNTFNINNINFESYKNNDEMSMLCSSVIQSISKISEERYIMLDRISVDDSDINRSTLYNNYITKLNEWEFLLSDAIKNYITKTSSFVNNNETSKTVKAVSTNVSTFNKDALFHFISDPKNIIGITLIGLLAAGTIIIVKNFKKIKEKIYNFFNK